MIPTTVTGCPFSSTIRPSTFGPVAILSDALWRAVLEAGEPFGVKVAAPSMARRVEAGMMNYGSDMTIENNPFEIMGLERLVEPQEADYIGKAALEDVRVRGV